MGAMRGRKQSTWTQREVDDLTSQIRGAVNELIGEGPDAQLRYLLTEITGAEANTSSTGRLQILLLCNFAIFHHARFGGLDEGHVTRLRKIGRSILLVQGIDPEASRFSYFFGDLQQAVSQINRRNGLHWQAAWSQYLSIRYGQRSSSANLGHGQLVMGNRLLRLGDGMLALAAYHQALKLGLDSHWQSLANLGIVQVLRLSGQVEAATELARTSLAAPSLPASCRPEFQWEQLCMGLRDDNGERELIAAIRPNGTHSFGPYVLEGMAYVFAGPVVRNHDLLPSLASRSQLTELAVDKSHPLFRFVRLIQHCYEKKFDSSEVIELISEELEHIAMVPTIMQEMLLWAATGRLLLRLKIRDQTLGIFCLNQYRAMGLRLTSGASDDPLFLRLPARDHEEAEGDPTARANPIDKAN